MKKYIILILLASISLFTNAQVQYLGTSNNHVVNRGAFVTDSMMRLPIRDTTFPTWYSSTYKKGSLIIKNSDTSLYYHNGTKWGKVGGSSIDTTSLSNRIDSKAGLTVPNNIFTGKITMGTSTGTGLLNFPDAGTTSTDGISFGSSVTNLYRISPSIIQTDGTLSVLGSIINQSTGKLALGDLNNITISPTSLTGSLATSAINLTQTWNTTGSPSLLFANITNTASGATANFMNLQISGVDYFTINKLGGVSIRSHITPFIGNTCDIGSSGIRFKDLYIGTIESRKIRTLSTVITDIPVTAKGMSGQTGNLFEAQDVSANVLMSVSPTGAVQSLYLKYGAGSPEGVVTAPIGCQYTNTTGTVGTLIYLKTSGTGNTGWTAIH